MQSGCIIRRSGREGLHFSGSVRTPFRKIAEWKDMVRSVSDGDDVQSLTAKFLTVVAKGQLTGILW